MNKIKIIVDKTKYILFSYRRRVEIGDVIVGDGLIQRESCVKFLGILID